METNYEINDNDAQIMFFEMSYLKSYKEAHKFLNDKVREFYGKIGYNPYKIKNALYDALGDQASNNVIFYNDYFRRIEDEIINKKEKQYITNWEIHHRKAKVVLGWLDKWDKERLPNTDNDVRLIPTEKGKEYIIEMFSNLLRLHYVEEDARNTWYYICGISNNKYVNPIMWLGSNLELYALINNFFKGSIFSNYMDMRNKDSICKFFQSKTYTPITWNSLGATKARKTDKDVENIWQQLKPIGMI
jgi:hypothetical protein